MKQIDPSVARVFQALGDPTRRAMLERLSSGPMSVSLLAEPFEMSLAAVVQHLQILQKAGLVKTEKVGRVRSCRVEASGLRAAEEWLRARRPEWDRKLDRLELFLDDPSKPRKSDLQFRSSSGADLQTRRLATGYRGTRFAISCPFSPSAFTTESSTCAGCPSCLVTTPNPPR